MKDMHGDHDPVPPELDLTSSVQRSYESSRSDGDSEIHEAAPEPELEESSLQAFKFSVAD